MTGGEVGPRLARECPFFTCVAGRLGVLLGIMLSSAMIGATRRGNNIRPLYADMAHRNQEASEGEGRGSNSCWQRRGDR